MRRAPAKTLLAVLALALAGGAARAAGPDAFSSLQQDPSPSAARRLAREYRGARNAYARLWLVNALYERVVRYSDASAFETLVAAADGDADPDVRRRAIESLASFRYLQGEAVRREWSARALASAKLAQASASPSIRESGVRLEEAARGWSAPARPAGEAAPSPAPGPLAPSQLPGALAWAACIHLLAMAWQWMAVRLLHDSGRIGEPVLSTWRTFRARPSLLLFPAGACPLLVVFLGFAAAYGAAWLESPGAAGAIAVLFAAAALYVACAMACFVPAAVLGGVLASPAPSVRASLGRLPGVCAMGLFLFAVVWPAEALLRLFGRRPRGGSAFAWAAGTGAPFAGVLAASVMSRESLGWLGSLRRAAGLFPAAGDDESSALFGRTLFQPQFLLAALAAFALMGFSLVPAMLFARFDPVQLFGWWLAGPETCVIAVGLWAGSLLSAGYLALLWSLGGARAAAMVSEASR